jgi:transcriptional regulator with XRE-family HTH domain
MATTRIATRIRNRRQELGWLQQELADRVGVDRVTVSNWETGKQKPERYIGKLEQVLGVSLEDDTEEDDLDELEQEFHLWLARRRRLREGRKESPNASIDRPPSRKAV